MFGKDDKEKKASAGKGNQAKSDFDLRLLKRVDLLELLYEQASENEQNAATVAELNAQLDRLKLRLDEKDAQIEHLKQRLNDKDAKIAELKESNALYARATEMVNVDELAKFQEMALREYLAALAAGK